MTEQRCKSCRYWGDTYRWIGEPMHDDGEPRACRLTLTDHNGKQDGFYGPGGHTDPREREARDSLALGQVDERGGGLVTQAEFGCVQWEPMADTEQEPPRYIVLWGIYAHHVRRFDTFADALAEYRKHDDARSLYVHGHYPQHMRHINPGEDTGLTADEKRQL